MKTSRLGFSIRNTFYLLALMWGGFFLQSLPFFNTSAWGIIPRYTGSLRGIITAPFMHGGWSHILSNSAPMAVLCMMLFYFYRKIALVSYILIHALTGFAVWMVARGSTIHIGASGVIYGLAAFIFWNGIFRRDLKSIILLLLVTFLYSGMLYGVVPNQPGISWESHLFGGIVGILVAFIMRGYDIKEHDDIEIESAKPLAEGDKEYYFDKDVFDRALRDQEERERRNL